MERLGECMAELENLDKEILQHAEKVFFGSEMVSFDCLSEYSNRLLAVMQKFTEIMSDADSCYIDKKAVVGKYSETVSEIMLNMGTVCGADARISDSLEVIRHDRLCEMYHFNPIRTGK